jgi:hypothetical protein
MRWHLVTLIIVLAACTVEPTPVPTETPSPEAVTERAALAMEQVATLHFVLEHSGAPVTVDPGQSIAFRSAEGDFVAPDRVRATVKLAAGNLISEVQIVTIGDKGWMTNLFTGRWERLPSGWGLDPAAFFDPQVGIPNLLAEGLLEVGLAGPLAAEGLEGENWRVTGLAQPSQLEAMSGGLFPDVPTELEAWIDPVSNLVHRVRLVLPASDPSEQGEWLLTLSGFGEDITIEPPL